MLANARYYSLMILLCLYWSQVHCRHTRINIYHDIRLVFPLLQWLGVLRCVQDPSASISKLICMFSFRVFVHELYFDPLLNRLMRLRECLADLILNSYTLAHQHTHTLTKSVEGMLFALFEHECKDNFLNIQTNNIFHSIIMKCCITKWNSSICIMGMSMLK